MLTTTSGTKGQGRGFTASSRITLHRYIRSTTYLGDDRIIVNTYRNEVHIIGAYRYVQTIEDRIEGLSTYMYELSESKSEGLDQVDIIGDKR